MREVDELAKALRTKQSELADDIISNGIPVRDFNLALKLTAYWGKQDTVETLLNRGNKILDSDPTFSVMYEEAIYWAYYNGQAELAQYIKRRLEGK